MKKIPTIFERDWTGDRSRVINKVNPVARWVFDGEGTPTRKLDGTCCRVHDGKLFKRRELRLGDPLPTGFESAGYDDETGKTVGWVPVGDGAEDQWHHEAFARYDAPFPDGTYELVGPKIQGNPEKAQYHYLIKHGDELAGHIRDVPTAFEPLRAWMAGKDIEGVVWHHPDGRMAKIKLRDFGIKRTERAP